ncbi:uncharacterized protein ACA1_368800 [Acanthamoeba castellanii str. Neff]|uniref:MRH domain-containing protein n=1 Tax=Acanthamoeba castellanii (strain ATCC 30010 / Neff) TaxID=1257118 RepID=L8H065_ACACF|nr:uncharacterized protein ACA1_368800 [Acanthamoeba castellanii str. Neff]ELR18148.1 hypothetical protein ACA1_368800 [Acanthamoeba castellanii str. Neff]
MKSSLIVAVLLGLVVVMASAHGGHHGKGAHGHHGGAAKESSHRLTCSYKNTKGHLFDLSRLSSKDLLVKDLVGGSTFHFNPCGSVHASQCPSGAAVCEITGKGEAISHGLAWDAHWADGVESGASLEVMYGRGEMCSDGVHRKTLVEMRCLHSSDPNTSPSFLMGVIKDECVLKLIVESPLACDVEAICSAVVNEATCNANSDLCDWKAGHCVPTDGHHSMWSSRQRVVTFAISALIGFTAVVFLCCSVTCACIACRRAAQRRKLRRSLPTYKKVKKVSDKKNKKVAAEELSLITPETPYESAPVSEAQVYPFQQYVMHQAADGSFVPFPVHMPMPVQPHGVPPHAYSYPMVQMMPAFHLQQHQPQQ